MVAVAFTTQTYAQGTAFTDQGRLEASGAPYTGPAEFQFSLWTADTNGSQLGSTLTASPVGVNNGLFTFTLDFGNQFPGENRWLELAVRTNLLGYTTLSPRQPLSATPYAITAGNLTGALPASQLSGTVPSANLSGTYSEAVTFNNAANSYTDDGSGLTSLDASQLSSGTVPTAVLGNAWKTGGNAGTTPGTHFLGTTDNQPLEFKVNGLRALRMEDNGDSPSDPDDIPDGAPNVIGGSPVNFVVSGVVGATIGGGGATNYFYLPLPNIVAADFGTIGGGRGNEIGTFARSCTIGGGGDNTVQTDASASTIGGGSGNTIETNAQVSTFPPLAAGSTTPTPVGMPPFLAATAMSRARTVSRRAPAPRPRTPARSSG